MLRVFKELIVNVTTGATTVNRKKGSGLVAVGLCIYCMILQWCTEIYILKPTCELLHKEFLYQLNRELFGGWICHPLKRGPNNYRKCKEVIASGTAKTRVF